MFSTYKQAVLATYRNQKITGSLPLRLTSMTPRNIQEELIQYLTERYDPIRDKKTLSVFFGEQECASEYVRIVSRTEVDKFKPVISFFKGNTTNPDDKQVHLAALLIDFEHRPFEFGKEYTVPGNQQRRREFEGVVEDHRKMSDEPTPDKLIKSSPLEYGVGANSSVRTESGNKVSVSKLLVAPKERLPFLLKITLFPIIAAVLVYTLFTVSINNKQCMYWTGDHYEAVACNATLKNNLYKIALDTHLLNNFKRITEVDTITEKSVGKVWYLKHQNAFEFFTMSGEHPVYRKKLVRLSLYIFRKELQPK